MRESRHVLRWLVAARRVEIGESERLRTSTTAERDVSKAGATSGHQEKTINKAKRGANT